MTQGKGKSMQLVMRQSHLGEGGREGKEEYLGRSRTN